MKKSRHETNERKFNDNWNALLSYWKEHGHANPPRDTVQDYYNIGSFKERVRHENKSGTLSPEREHKLRILNFDFEPKATNRCNQQQRQQQILELLKEYVQGFGRLPTTPENGKYKGEQLYRWVHSKKMLYSQGKVADQELFRELEELGVVFGRTVEDYQDERNEKIRDVWLENYNELLKHFCEHGDTSPKLGTKLRSWRGWQPQKFRAGNMSEVEKHLLGVLGIDVTTYKPYKTRER